jgi:hypothetical protein
MRKHIVFSLMLFLRVALLQSANPVCGEKLLSEMRCGASNSVMGPKFSEGADKSQLMRESNALLEGGWTLDEEQIGVKKTYYDTGD